MNSFNFTHNKQLTTFTSPHLHHTFHTERSVKPSITMTPGSHFVISQLVYLLFWLRHLRLRNLQIFFLTSQRMTMQPFCARLHTCISTLISAISFTVKNSNMEGKINGFSLRTNTKCSQNKWDFPSWQQVQIRRDKKNGTVK